MYKVQLLNPPYEDAITIHIESTGQPKILNAKVQMSVNSTPGFSFTINPGNPGYDLIQPMMSEVVVTDTAKSEEIFRGRPVSASLDMDASGMVSKSYVCAGILDWLHDSVPDYQVYKDITVYESMELLLDQHNAQVERHKQLLPGDVWDFENDLIAGEFDGISDTYDLLFSQVLDPLRAETDIYWDDYEQCWRVNIRGRIGKVSPVVIQLGHNLISQGTSIDISKVTTRLKPRGPSAPDTGPMTIASVNGGLDYIQANQIALDQYGLITRVEEFEAETPTQLLTMAQRWMQRHEQVLISIECNVVDLGIVGEDPEPLKVGNIYNISNRLLGTETQLRLIEMSIDLNSPALNSVRFGSISIRTSSQWRTTEQELMRQKNEIRKLKAR